MEDWVKSEISKAFPGEKVRNIYEVRIRPLPPKEGLNFDRKSYGVFGNGILAVTPKHIILATGKRNYDVIMTVAALVFIIAGICVLLTGINTGTLITLILGLIIFLGVEGFLFLQRTKPPLTSFEKEKAKIEKDEKGRSIVISGVTKGEYDWLTEEKRFEVLVSEEGKMPEL